MSKKNYIAIAKVMLKNNPVFRTSIKRNLWNDIVYDLSKCFSRENEKFNKEEFISACLGE